MRRRGLEPLRGYPHYHLKVARIPFRHLRMVSGAKYMRNDRFVSRAFCKNVLALNFARGLLDRFFLSIFLAVDYSVWP